MGAGELVAEDEGVLLIPGGSQIPEEQEATKLK